ncbi:hypothetical protein [Albidovulum sp.]|uniref:hypothetical protein n=1 Tax=Albidovulum sp. TaxID=1872424 RepID=UPI0039B896F5
MATDVAEPPAPGGELPSFEELLAKGSFQARLAQARLKREKALAESGDTDGFILDTTRKPWEREAGRTERRDPMTSALGNSVAVEGAAPARRGTRTAARPAARPRGGGLSAKVVPIRQGNILWLEFPVAPDSGAGAAVGAALPRREIAVPDPAAPIAAAAVAPVPTVRRAAMVTGGFLSGLMIGAAVMMALPYHGDAVASWRGTEPFTGAVQSDAVAASPRPATRAATRPATGTGTPSSFAMPAVQITTPQAAPDAAGETGPGVPAPIAALAAALLPAQGLAPGESPDAAPAVPGGAAAPDVAVRLDRAQGPVLPDAAAAVPAAASPGSLPWPDGQPAVAPAVMPGSVLAAATPFDAPLPVQENPPAATPAPGGPIIVNAPESVGEAELAGLVEGLGAAGFALAEPTRVDIPISESNVRFFHPGDAAAAQAVASRLGARVRDFTSFTPSPPAGTIEVWLSGRGNAAAPAKTRRASGQGAVTAEERELNLLRDRILQQLRNGEHL